MANSTRSKLYTGPYLYPVRWTISVECRFTKPTRLDEWGDCKGMADVVNAEARSMWAIPPVGEEETERTKHIGFTLYLELPEAFKGDPEKLVQKLFGYIFGHFEIASLYAWLDQEQSEDTIVDDEGALTIHQVRYIFNHVYTNPIQRYALDGRVLRELMDCQDDLSNIGPFTYQLLVLACTDVPLTTKCSFPIVRSTK